MDMDFELEMNEEFGASDFATFLGKELSCLQCQTGYVFQSKEGPDLGQDSREMKIRDKIVELLRSIATNDDDPPSFTYSVHFWAVRDDERGQYLTAEDQPFSTIDFSKGICWFRRLCMDHRPFVQAGADEEDFGPIWRVYKNLRPETSPDLKFYSVREYPSCDAAANYGAVSFVALPVFAPLAGGELDCYGVLQIVSHAKSTPIDTFGFVKAALQATNLICDHDIFNPRNPMPNIGALQAARMALEKVSAVHLINVWGACEQCLAHGEIVCWERIGSAIQSCPDMLQPDYDMSEFVDACTFHRLRTNEVPLYKRFSKLNILEYPLAHYAQKARLSSRYAFSLRDLDAVGRCYLMECFLSSSADVELMLDVVDANLQGLRFDLLPPLHRMPNANNLQPDMKLPMKTFENRISEMDFIDFMGSTDVCCQSGEQSGWVFNGKAAGGSELQRNIQIVMKQMVVQIPAKRHCVIQFWAPKMEEDMNRLETSEQPYALSNLSLYAAKYRRTCSQHRYHVGGTSPAEDLGPPGRVYQSGYPELSPNLCLYSTKEFALRDEAAHCGQRSYSAIPVFDAGDKCVGVLELVGLTNSELQTIAQLLAIVKLRSAHVHTPTYPRPNERVANAFLQFARIPQVFNVELWATSGNPDPKTNMICLELVHASKNDGSHRWSHAHIGKGVVGMALTAITKSCIWQSIQGVSITDEPLSHFQLQRRCDICFAICSQNSRFENKHFVLKFFLCPGPEFKTHIESFLGVFMQIMKDNFEFVMNAPEPESHDKLVIDSFESPGLCRRLTFVERSRVLLSSGLRAIQQDICSFWDLYKANDADVAVGRGNPPASNVAENKRKERPVNTEDADASNVAENNDADVAVGRGNPPASNVAENERTERPVNIEDDDVGSSTKVRRIENPETAVEKPETAVVKPETAVEKP